MSMSKKAAVVHRKSMPRLEERLMLHFISRPNLLEKIDLYYRARKLKKPSTGEALLWAMSELGELVDVYMEKKGGWVRNHKKPIYRPERFGEEAGDVIMMIIRACMNEGVDPLEHIERKMALKLQKHLRQRGG